MDVLYAYTYSTSSWLAVQAVPLIISPTIVLALLSPEVRQTTSLEEYLCRALGLSLLTLCALILLLTGSIPLTSSSSDTTTSGITSDASDPKAPYAAPVLTISMLYHAAMGFYCYARYSSVHGKLAFALGAITSSLLAFTGLWCLLFASQSGGRISKNTGADKRTSGFPFGNRESARAKKKNMYVGKII